MNIFYYAFPSEGSLRKFTGLASVFENRAITAIAEIAERTHSEIILYERIVRAGRQRVVPVYAYRNGNYYDAWGNCVRL